MKIYIVPISELSTELLDKLNTALTSKGLKPLLIGDVRKIVKLMVEEVVFRNLQWTKLNGEFTEYVDMLLEGIVPDDSNALYGIIDLMEVKVMELLSGVNAINRASDYWSTWHTRNIGGDLIVEQGADYRILAWECLVRDGRIPKII